MALKNRTETMKAEESNNKEESQLLVGHFCYGIKKD